MNSIAQWCGILVAIVIAAIAALGGHDANVGGTTAGFENAVLGFRVNGTTVISSTRAATFSSLTNGTNGTAVTRINTGLCNILAGPTTISATSSKVIDCGSGTTGGTALTGVAAGDKCFLGQATTTPSNGFGGLTLEGVSASTTQGFVTALVHNMTGATFTWTAAASTSWQYLCLSS